MEKEVKRIAPSDFYMNRTNDDLENVRDNILDDSQIIQESFDSGSKFKIIIKSQKR